MQLHKTERARAELKPGTRTLGQRERTLLLLADGNKSVLDFQSLFNGEGEQIALRLLHEGFLEAHPGNQLLAGTAVASTLIKTIPNNPSQPLSAFEVTAQQSKQHYFTQP